MNQNESWGHHPAKPSDFDEVIEIEDLELRAIRARDFPYPWIMYATSGNGPEAQINRILWESELRDADEGPPPTPNPGPPKPPPSSPMPKLNI